MPTLFVIYLTLSSGVLIHIVPCEFLPSVVTCVHTGEGQLPRKSLS